MPDHGRRRFDRAPAWLAAAASVGFLLATAAVLVARLHPTCELDHNVGVYVSLAELARQGIVYPHEQTADLLYCTLYQPLGFLPYAALPGSGLSLIPSIRALVRIEVFACLSAAVLLARRFGAGWPLALTLAAVLACALPVSAAMLKCIDDPRGTLVAIAAVAVFVGRGAGEPARLHPWRAAPLFALAFLTKLTAPCAAGVAAIAVAVRRRQPGAALRLLGASAVWTAAAYAVAHLVLGWDLAGNGLRFALFDAKPGRSLGQQAAHFAADLVREPVLAGLLLGALLVAGARVVRRRAGGIEVWFLAALARAFVEYGSHGTELNHLFEPTLLAGVLVAAALAPVLAGWRLLALPAALALAAGFGWPVLGIPCGNDLPLASSPIATAASVLAAQPPQPTLCEDPLLAITAGQRPLVTDPFLAGLVLDRHPEIRAAWFGAAEAPGALQRLVLIANPEQADGAAASWYTHLHFDARFLADVRRAFRVLAATDYGTVLVRR